MTKSLPIINVDVTRMGKFDVTEEAINYRRMLSRVWGIPEEYLIPKRFVMNRKTNHSISFSITHVIVPSVSSWKVVAVLMAVFVLLVVGLS
jgi:hypothetical protein